MNFSNRPRIHVFKIDYKLRHGSFRQAMEQTTNFRHLFTYFDGQRDAH